MEIVFQLNLSPTQPDLNEIEKWLIEEYKTFGDGFYCNWAIIEKAFRNKKFITLEHNNFPIGFLVWNKGEIYAEIDIMVIKPENRNSGIGKYFFNQIAGFFKEKGFLAIKLFCSPSESEKFWKKMDFIKFPDRGYSESELMYYKPLIEIQQTTKNNSDNKIELWNVESYQAKNHEPKWTWEVNSTLGKLLLPIIQPCNCNWNLRWTKNGKKIREDKVKYFSENNRIEFDPFLFITELNE
ncbi:GNAT family N-acetyltransferase [Aureibaculum sp. A20]|uniref:GNAT family N-acetyltransferase n=1 Tax=Aureibaculum flavum TaxID=2795986 RepID=A0ABS0WQN8_9FLAO|nr:GNAT family N-acetyltransferase [Aureibaculum flavum]MBJ2174183.1 GNAT family N-acetyltransferase [Aureibaculum flavum]